MSENRFFAALFMDNQPEPDVEFLDTGHISSGNGVGTVKDDAGINVGKGHMILFAIVRKEDADTVIEVESDTFDRFQSRYLRDLSIDAGLFGLFLSRSGRRSGSLGNRRSGIDTDGNIVGGQSIDCKIFLHF